MESANAPVLTSIIKKQLNQSGFNRVGVEVFLDNENHQLHFEIFIYRKMIPIKFGFNVPYSEAKPANMQKRLILETNRIIRGFQDGKYSKDKEPIAFQNLGPNNPGGGIGVN